MSYTLTVTTTHEGQELVACFLEEMGAMGVSIADAYDLQALLANKSSLYWDYIEDDLLHMDSTVYVCGFFNTQPTAAAVDNLVQRLDYARTQMPVDMGQLSVTQGQTTNDDAWFDNWRNFYHPIHIGDITVLPAWFAPGEQDKIVVRIDPGTAFGTGEHESTQMCLDLLQRLDVRGMQVADIGCGSGVLGIAAMHLGAAHCYFADIDATAIGNCRANIALNGVAPTTEAAAPLLEGCPVRPQLVFANITADVLLLLAQQIRPYHVGQGYLIISGIIEGRQQQVLDAFAAADYALVDQTQRGDWHAYLLQAKWN